MFDAKSLFEMMVKGGNPSQTSAPAASSGGQGGMPDLGDLLRQFTDGGKQDGGSQSASPSSSGGSGGGNPLQGCSTLTT